MSSERFGSVVLQLDGAVARLRLSRPRRLNALDGAALEGIVTAARAIDSDPQVKAVILCAEGDDFSAGADLRSPPARSQAELVNALRRAAELGRAAIAAVRHLRPATIALVQGRAIGGGFVLAAACDLRVVTDDCVFSLPEVDLGIPVGWGGVPVLVGELGAALARELILTCRPLPAEEAARVGFVTQVAPRDRSEDVARTLAERLAAKPAGAVARSKQQLLDALAGGSSQGSADADLILAALTERLAERGAESWNGATWARVNGGDEA